MPHPNRKTAQRHSNFNNRKELERKGQDTGPQQAANAFINALGGSGGPVDPRLEELLKEIASWALTVKHSKLNTTFVPQRTDEFNSFTAQFSGHLPIGGTKETVVGNPMVKQLLHFRDGNYIHEADGPYHTVPVMFRVDSKALKEFNTIPNAEQISVSASALIPQIVLQSAAPKAEGSILLSQTDIYGERNYIDVTTVREQKNKVEADKTYKDAVGKQFLRLRNDEFAPGSDKYYGTDASGNKGFHEFPSLVTQVGETTKLYSEYECGMPIPAFSVVIIGSDGKIYLADNNDLTHVSKIIGISRTSGLIGDTIKVQTNGLLTSVNQNLIPNTSYFLGTTPGSLSTIPSTGFIQRLGVAKSSNELEMNLTVNIRRA